MVAEMVAKEKKGLHLDVLAARVKKAGFTFKNPAQVINLQHKRISGQYAAGEVTGGIHGAVRLGSVAVTDCLFYGRIAGQNAAAEKPKS